MNEPQNQVFKPKKNKPILQRIHFVEDLDDEDPDRFEKIIHYATKYRIPFKEAGFKKSYQVLTSNIQEHEKKHFKSIALGGPDRKYLGEIGIFLRS